jgi:beta-carotene/zeaxanthin 4-ketolase
MRTPADKSARDAIISQAIAVAIGIAWLSLHFITIFGAAAGDWPVLWLVGVLLVQTWLSAGLFIIAHDCMHGALAPGRPAINRAIGRMALMIYAGLDFDRMMPAHFAHHRHVGTAGDPDFNAVAPRAAGQWFLRFFANYYTHSQLLRITVVACLYLLMGASLVNIAVFWAIPALLALGQLFFFGTFLPHRHGRKPFADRHRARSVGPGGLVSLLSCFHFGGYHHEHHLVPQAPWWRLPAVRTARGR